MPLLEYMYCSSETDLEPSNPVMHIVPGYYRLELTSQRTAAKFILKSGDDYVAKLSERMYSCVGQYYIDSSDMLIFLQGSDEYSDNLIS